MRERNFLPILIVSLIALVVFFLLASLAAGATSKRPFLYSLRVIYYRLLYQTTDAQNNPQKMKDLHRATKIAVEEKDSETPLYVSKTTTDERRDIVQADSIRCVACHGSMVKAGKQEAEDERHEEAQNHEETEKREEEKHSLHQEMLTVPLLSFQCTDCHKKVDIRKHSPRHVTIRVDRKLCGGFPCHNPSAMAQHGKDEETSKKWLFNHPKVLKNIGINECLKCHRTKELNFCRECHERGGMMASSHQAIYQVPIKRLYPEMNRGDILATKWKGFHFVFAREALQKMGVSEVSAANLPMDKIEKLPCQACHVLKEWCTRCHIKHAPTWLDPVKGHPARVKKYGSDYCFKCHDPLGSKCIACHRTKGVREL